ncbi:MAG: hypothetical protein JNL58_04070 [Planctomyces sp.]|nr:hypothetical protein [Planctomyces sp.]
MDAQHLKHVLQSTAAGTLLLLSAELVIAEHLIQYDPDRPQVSAATSPIWGYNRPCWRRFPQTPPCGHCDSGVLSTGEYLPSEFPSQPSFYAPQSSVYTPQSNAQKPVSVLPGGTNAQTSPAPPAVDATLLPQPQPQPQPQQSPVPQGGRPLPPLPGPPTSITPVPDPGPIPQQSRHTQPSLWLPSNSMNGSRYGQVPVSTISSSVSSTVISGAALSGPTGSGPAITGPTTMTPSGLILPTGNRISVPGQGRYAQPGR